MELPDAMAHSVDVGSSRLGSLRGVEGSVEKILDAFRQRTERLGNSSVLRKINEVGKCILLVPFFYLCLYA